MAQLRNAAQMYQQGSVKTASPAKLTLMLYDGAVRFCNIAKEAIAAGDFEKANTNIMKAEKIIVELRVTLDMKYPVAKDFDRVYEYLEGRLIQANVKKDEEILNEVLEHLRSMRDTWKEVMRINREKGVVC